MVDPERKARSHSLPFLGSYPVIGVLRNSSVSQTDDTRRFLKTVKKGSVEPEFQEGRG